MSRESAEDAENHLLAKRAAASAVRETKTQVWEKFEKDFQLKEVLAELGRPTATSDLGCNQAAEGEPLEASKPKTWGRLRWIAGICNTRPVMGHSVPV